MILKRIIVVVCSRDVAVHDLRYLRRTSSFSIVRNVNARASC